VGIDAEEAMLNDEEEAADVGMEEAAVEESDEPRGIVRVRPCGRSRTMPWRAERRMGRGAAAAVARRRAREMRDVAESIVNEIGLCDYAREAGIWTRAPPGRLGGKEAGRGRGIVQ
jgi:hypothetical protein